MSKEETKIVAKPEDKLKVFIATNYMTQIKNYFGDEKKAMKFLSSIVADVQRNPTLLECDPKSLINSYMVMASCEFMPSGVSGEAYVLPYNNKAGKIAQFQMGYQGLVTLFYRAGVEKIVSGIVREKDNIEITNNTIVHKVDPRLSKSKRGEPIGAYVIVTFKGEENAKYMNGKDILAHASKFSKSYSPTGQFSPWNPANDPELAMWIKTVLKQHAKLLPKNETINRAIAEDNKDSIMADRIEEAKRSSESMNMGNLLTTNEKNKENQDYHLSSEENQEPITDAKGDEINPFKAK